MDSAELSASGRPVSAVIEPSTLCANLQHCPRRPSASRQLQRLRNSRKRDEWPIAGVHRDFSLKVIEQIIHTLTTLHHCCFLKENLVYILLIKLFFTDLFYLVESF